MPDLSDAIRLAMSPVASDDLSEEIASAAAGGVRIFGGQRANASVVDGAIRAAPTAALERQRYVAAAQPAVSRPAPATKAESGLAEAVTAQIKAAGLAAPVGVEPPKAESSLGRAIAAQIARIGRG